MYRYKNAMKKNEGGPRKCIPVTDLSRWRLKCKNGRQTWIYHDDKDIGLKEQSLLECHSLGLPTENLTPMFSKPDNPREAVINGMEFFAKLQVHDGHWAGDYGGPMFLIPGLVITCYVTETALLDHQRLEIIRYLRSVECPDGGWGLHINGRPTVFGCTLNYVAMRLLGITPNDPTLERARKVLLDLGGAIGIYENLNIFTLIRNMFHVMRNIFHEYC